MIFKTLLTITARGNAIITELNRLYELVPSVFLRLDEPSGQHYLDPDKKYTINELICDFSYFKITDSFEAKIDASETLKRADEEFCNNYADILTRFYLTFESVQRYANDLNTFVQEIDDDVYVGHTFDALLADTESRQLVCESYFLLGYMLLTIDNYFESSLRERMIVSYYRYSAFKSSPSSNLDETCNLMRTTGFLKPSSQKSCAMGAAAAASAAATKGPNSAGYRPEGYPESFFARVAVNGALVNLLVSKLLSLDIYNQTVLAFPQPDHRSTALSVQASMLYVILYFCPNILSSQRSKMREITDKFFYDNWIVSIYMGDLVNLIEAWNPYRAARESLTQLLELDSTRALVEQNRARFERTFRQLQDYLKEGWLDESRVLEHHPRILTLIRESNVILRWFLMHSHSKCDWNLRLSKSVRALVLEIKPTDEDLYMCLQNLAEIEKKFLALYESLLLGRESMTIESRSRAGETLDELVSIFSDPKPMRYIQPGLHTKLSSQLTELSRSLRASSGSSGGQSMASKNEVIKLINELDQMQELYSDGKNLQVVQLFSETKDSLLQVLRCLSLSAEIRTILHAVGDFSYGWRILAETFRLHMQQIIKENPLRVYGIEATFLKLASAFDVSLIRIQQLGSKSDLISVSKYYSSKLMCYIRDVLHIIPATILELLGSIIQIQTHCVMGELPSKINLDKLRDYSLADKRFQMLELTYKVSHYAESLMLMQDTVIGLIQVDSRQLLEDGIRRELVRRMSDSIHETLSSSSIEATATSGGSSSAVQQLANNFTLRLSRLDEIMSGFKRSLEYVQDYLLIYGLKMWQEELSRIVKFNLSQATSALLGKSYLLSRLDGVSSQAGDELDQHDSNSSAAAAAAAANRGDGGGGGKISVPIYDSNPLKSSFIVLILDELLKITDPRSTVYDEQMSAWYEQRGQHNRVLDLKAFELIGSSLGIVGLNGLDQMCSVLLMLELQRLDELLITIGGAGGHDDQGGGGGGGGRRRTASGTRNLLDSLDSVAKLRHTQLNFGAHYQAPATLITNKQMQRIYSGAVRSLAPYSEQIVNHLSSVGQLQLLRISIGCVLSTRSRCEARNLYNCLDTLNGALLATLKQQQQWRRHRGTPEDKLTVSSSQHKITAPSAAQQVADVAAAAAADTTQLNEANNSEAAAAAAAASSVESRQLDHDDHNQSLNLSESQLIFELTNHLEWIGLSDPLSKIYTLALQESRSSQVFQFRRSLRAVDMMFVVLLEQCSRFLFSKSVGGFLPKPARGFYESVAAGNQAPPTDGQPIFYGLITLLNHYEPFLAAAGSTDGGGGDESSSEKLEPFEHLLGHMGFYARCSLEHRQQPTPLRPQELTLETVNMILSTIELARVARLPVARTLAASTRLPEFIFDVFQFTICQLNQTSSIGAGANTNNNTNTNTNTNTNK